MNRIGYYQVSWRKKANFKKADMVCFLSETDSKQKWKDKMNKWCYYGRKRVSGDKTEGRKGVNVLKNR